MRKAPITAIIIFYKNMHIDHFKIGFQNSFLLRKQFVACEAKQKEGNWPFWLGFQIEQLAFGGYGLGGGPLNPDPHCNSVGGSNQGRFSGRF